MASPPAMDTQPPLPPALGAQTPRAVQASMEALEARQASRRARAARVVAWEALVPAWQAQRTQTSQPASRPPARAPPPPPRPRRLRGSGGGGAHRGIRAIRAPPPGGRRGGRRGPHARAGSHLPRGLHGRGASAGAASRERDTTAPARRDCRARASTGGRPRGTDGPRGHATVAWCPGASRLATRMPQQRREEGGGVPRRVGTMLQGEFWVMTSTEPW